MQTRPLRTAETLVHATTPSEGSNLRRTRRIPTLLGTQLLFNVGFYAVMPFLTVALTADFGLTGAAVGLVLGVRTFAQQGMFLFGGALADRYGARAVILLGTAVRSAGFLALAASLWCGEPSLSLLVIDTVLTGLGGALFSPSLSTLVAEAERNREGSGARQATLFAWLNVTGEIGAVAGPILGAALLGWGFAAVAASGAAAFAAIDLFLFIALPRGAAARPPHAPVHPDAHGSGSAASRNPFPALRDRRFIAFAALHSVDLLSYNQLYLAIPLLLSQSGHGPQLVGAMFAWVSALTLALQLPVARWSASIGPRAALRTGYLLSGIGFLVLALDAMLRASGYRSLTAAMLAVTLLALDHLFAAPTAFGAVSGFADGRASGSYFGLLSSVGGAAVLLGNLLVGALLEVAAGDAGSMLAASPWLVLAALSLTSGALVGTRRIWDCRHER